MDVKSECEIYPEDVPIYAPCIFHMHKIDFQYYYNYHFPVLGSCQVCRFFSVFSSSMISDVLELLLTLLCVKTFKEYNLVPKNKLSNILIHNSFQWETLVSRSFPELGVGYYFDVNLLFFWICLGPFWFKSPFGVVSLFELKMFTVILK